MKFLTFLKENVKNVNSFMKTPYINELSYNFKLKKRAEALLN